MSGRPIKAALDYFELDCHMEEKVRLIQAEFGLKGFAIVVKLYQKIYGELGYYCEWNEDSSLLFMSENGVSSRDEKNLIDEIVSACIRRDIFSERLFKKFGILTSSGIQKRYLNATAKRERVELKKEYLLVSDAKNNKNVVINSISDGINSISGVGNSQSRVEKSRVEKSRVEKRKDICSEPADAASEPPVFSLLLNDGTEYPITQQDIDNWQELYPAIDVMQELRKMRGWCDANPTRRKTRNGVKRFINGWLAKEQDRGARNTKRTVFDEWRDA